MIEILPPEASLPAPYIRRLDARAEEARYVARPGIRAIPAGSLTVFAFAALQAWTLTILLWAIWWPFPQSDTDWGFSLIASATLLVLVAGVVVLLLRRYPGFLLAVMRAPFIRLTVTDRRILWTLPWMKAPLMEIRRDRVVGGILGQVDARGNGNAALVLVPGDPSADVDGNIHFDRLPDAAGFIAALRG
ncbi:hypothetical protein [Sphingomonas bacterium]|uniref:hypothetical protein n=1 Tax=Sphingomonas bacterium TaxID=1895847 RepID=UPI0015755DB0|nr:hypothetical protein [Sphingomonas bacterium]